MSHNETIQKSEELEAEKNIGSLCDDCGADSYQFIHVASDNPANKIKIQYQSASEVNSIAVEKAFDVLFDKMFSTTK